MENVSNEQDWSHVAEIELIYKTKVKPSLRPTIKKSSDCYQVFLQKWDINKIEFVEEFKVMLLNRANKVLGLITISSGTVTACPVEPRHIILAAIEANACSIILAHNHPSGSLKPSPSDLDITKKISDGAKFFDLKVLDHLIITNEAFMSFSDEGLL